MRITVHHVTRYAFASSVAYSIQRLRLTPRSFAGQRVVEWRVLAHDAEPACRFRDAFGNEVQLAARAGAHDEVVVAAAGIVETSEAHGVVRDLKEAAAPRVYLRSTPVTLADAAIIELANATRGADLIERLHDLMAAVHAAIVYETGATRDDTTAAEALAAGRGVCQDHAHVFIAAARSFGVPARYVTGYLVGADGAPAAAHHAWAEAFVSDLGWVGFDAANAVCPAETYVRLACGLDGDGAAPVRGSRRGGGAETLEVEVAVAQQATQQ